MEEMEIYRAPESNVVTHEENTELKDFASFGKRFLALILDGLILMVIGFVSGGITLALQFTDIIGEVTGSIIDIIFSVIIGWLYYALMESSSTQGTLGKMALSIKVIDMEGRRVSFTRATGRHFGAYLSALILGIGYFIQPFNASRQTLHDQMASCLVTEK